GAGTALEDAAGYRNAGPVEVTVVAHDRTLEQDHPSGRGITGHARDRALYLCRSQALQHLRVLAGVNDLAGLGEVAGALQFVDGQVSYQAEVCAFAHHGRPEVTARGPQCPGYDGARDLVGADADAMPQQPAFLCRGCRGAAEC